MESRFSWKLGTIGVLMVLLLVGLFWIGSIVKERQARRDDVVQDIARSSSGPQRLQGPIFVVPYRRTIRNYPPTEGQLLILPEVFRLDGELPTQRRSRGIYEARLYHAKRRMRARFEIPAHYGVGAELAEYEFGQPSIAVGVADIRGIESTTAVTLNNEPVKLLPGSTSSRIGAGVHALVPVGDASQPSQLEFTLNLGLQGTSDFNVTPVGRQTQVALSSDWPSPSFAGEFLPTWRTGLLSADDYALLLGSALVFALLASVMVLTRNVDWSRLSDEDESHLNSP